MRVVLATGCATLREHLPRCAVFACETAAYPAERSSRRRNASDAKRPRDLLPRRLRGRDRRRRGHQESPARVAPSRQRSRTTPGAATSRPRAARSNCAFTGRYLDRLSIEARGRLSPMLRTRVLGESGVDATAGATPVSERVDGGDARPARRWRRCAPRRPARAPLCSCGRRGTTRARGRDAGRAAAASACWGTLRSPRRAR